MQSRYCIRVALYFQQHTQKILVRLAKRDCAVGPSDINVGVFTPSQLVTILTACDDAGHKNPALFNALSQQVMLLAGEFDPEQLVQILSSARRLGRASSEVFEAVGEQASPNFVFACARSVVWRWLRAWAGARRAVPKTHPTAAPARYSPAVTGAGFLDVLGSIARFEPPDAAVCLCWGLVRLVRSLIEDHP